MSWAGAYRSTGPRATGAERSMRRARPAERSAAASSQRFIALVLWRRPARQRSQARSATLRCGGAWLWHSRNVRITTSALLLAASLSALPFSGCICGEALIVDDIFVPPDARTAPGTLHTYASNARVGFEIRSASAFLAIADVEVAVDGAVTTDDDNVSTVDGDVLKLNVRTQEAGEGTLLFTRNGEVLAERTVTVVDTDAIALSVTAPSGPGLDLPAVDLENTRIFAGGRAAFRTTLTSDGDEIFGLDAVTIEVTDATITSRNGVACAADGCGQARNAVELSLPTATTDAFTATFTSGSASIDLDVVPTTVAEVTAIESDVRETTDLVDGDLTGVVAQVLAGDEPVFGAPVLWAIDGAAVANDDGDVVTGDALQLAFASNDTATVEARLGDRAFNVDVESNGEDAAVTSITAACGAGSIAPLWLALAALVARKRRAA